MYDVDWPMCGERRKEVRKNPRNQWEQKLAESLRGGKETIIKPEIKKPIKVYDWEIVQRRSESLAVV